MEKPVKAFQILISRIKQTLKLGFFFLVNSVVKLTLILPVQDQYGFMKGLTQVLFCETSSFFDQGIPWDMFH